MCRNPGPATGKGCQYRDTIWCYTTDGEKDYCVPKDLEQSDPVTSHLYRGYQTRTISGRLCQDWSVQTPHMHSYCTETLNHQEGLYGNFCRNPSLNGCNKDTDIWCYTTDPDMRIEKCAPLEYDPEELRGFQGRKYRGF